jgi:hypothetical protein
VIVGSSNAIEIATVSAACGWIVTRPTVPSANVASRASAHDARSTGRAAATPTGSASAPRRKKRPPVGSSRTMSSSSVDALTASGSSWIVSATSFVVAVTRPSASRTFVKRVDGASSAPEARATAGSAHRSVPVPAMAPGATTATAV